MTGIYPFCRTCLRCTPLCRPVGLTRGRQVGGTGEARGSSGARDRRRGSGSALREGPAHYWPLRSGVTSGEAEWVSDRIDLATRRSDPAKGISATGSFDVGEIVEVPCTVTVRRVGSPCFLLRASEARQRHWGAADASRGDRKVPQPEAPQWRLLTGARPRSGRAPKHTSDGRLRAARSLASVHHRRAVVSGSGLPCPGPLRPR